MEQKRFKLNYDKWGIVTSAICAVHCTVLPLFVSTLPLMGIEVLENKAIEWSLILLSMVFGITSLQHGYRRHHGKIYPVFLFVTGFTFLIVNQLTHEQFILLLIPLSAILIITAHSWNLYLSRRK